MPISLFVVFSALGISPLLMANESMTNSNFPRQTLTVRGVKFPNSRAEGLHPLMSTAPATDVYTGYTELLPYLMTSPNQEEAGSCLYMSLTGNIEWWMAKLNPNSTRLKDGPQDFSERFIMNLSNHTDGSALGVKNWVTDSILYLNAENRVATNSTYRFTKGYSKMVNGKRARAKPEDADVDYSTLYNWIDESHLARSEGQPAGNQPQAQFVDVPKFERIVLHADANRDVWNIGEMPGDIVERVKTSLRTNRAPVQVVYNHMGYWHAVLVAGFDDQRNSQACPFVEDTRRYFKGLPLKNPPYIQTQFTISAGPVLGQFLNLSREPGADPAQALRYERNSLKLEKAYADGGGCSGKGIFYVRDSIYDDESEGMYLYNPEKPNDKSPYTRRIILREYEWLRYLGNHAQQILAIH